MRSALQAHRRRSKSAARIRYRRRPRRVSDLPEFDDDDEEIVEIGGGPADDKPSTG